MPQPMRGELRDACPFASRAERLGKRVATDREQPPRGIGVEVLRQDQLGLGVEEQRP